MLDENIQQKKGIYPFYKILINANESILTKSRPGVAWGWGRGQEMAGEVTKEREEVLGVRDVFITLILMVVLQMCAYIKTYQTVHFNYKNIQLLSVIYTSQHCSKIITKGNGNYDKYLKRNIDWPTFKFRSWLICVQRLQNLFETYFTIF